MRVAVLRADGTSPLADGVRRASNPWTRFVGLMGRSALRAGEGLLLEPCKSVHTCFMRFPIDVLYLNRENEVVKVVPAMRPWRFSWGGRGARAVLELPAAAANDVVVGQTLGWEPQDS